jgi:DNA (cytosine-5)-methyltransferase 1
VKIDYINFSKLINTMSHPKKRPVVAKTAISLFSGAGGDSLGLKQAGYNVVAFSEFKKPAINTHLKEFPASRLLTCPETASTDITKIPDETFEYYLGQVDVIFSGFPCFTSGTIILTNSGYKEIQNVTLKDTLLTHTGKFQNIVNLQRKTYNGTLYDLKLKYHPEIITATEEHPFYVRESLSKTPQTFDAPQTFGAPQWKKASELNMNDFYGMVINRREEIPDNMDSLDQWFMMGYFAGTSSHGGWIRNNNTICFNFNNHYDTFKIIERINGVLPLVRNHGGLIYRSVNVKWCNILKSFTNTSDIHIKKHKLIPEWVQNAPQKFIKSFLEGYLASYTSDNDNYIIRTTSYNIAYGLQRLYLKIDKIIDVHIISCHELQYNTYQLIITDNNTGTSFIEGDYVWWEPISITSRDITDEPVYNFEVDVDNSYVVYNTIVHNCQGFSNAGKKRADDPRNELVNEFVRVVNTIKPRYIIGENVHGLLSRQGNDPITKKLRPIIDIIRDLFSAIGYNITYKVLKATDFGVAQERRRLIIVGTPQKGGGLYPHMPWDSLNVPTFPKAASIRGFLETHLEGAVPFKEENIPDGLSRHYWIITKDKEVLGKPHPNLLRLNGGIRNKSSKEKEAQGSQNDDPVTVEGGLISFGVRRSAYHGQILDPDLPCKTIICTYGTCPRLFVGLYNPDEMKYWVRCLSVKELAQIQGFPAEYQWQGNEKEIITQIGNAVPPALCESVIRSLPNIVYKDTIQVNDEKSNKNKGVDSEDEGEE